MKKILCFTALLGFINYASAQNTFPTAAGSNVGIGTTTPAEQLEVTNSSTGAIRISSQKAGLLATDIIGKLNFYKADVSAGGSGVVASIQSRSYDSGGAFDMDFVTGSVSTPVTAMTLHYNGRVGIGTNNPSALFHLNGINSTANSRGNLFISTSDAPVIDAGGQVSFGGSYTTDTQTYWAGIAGRKENATDANYAGYLQFSTRKNGSTLLERMRITSEGNVGIGTATPPAGFKLAVNGNVIATSVTVKVYNDWPDYVFKKDYKLPKLTEVKDYIDKNQHLPDMPSEKEVVNNGLNLGEMNKVLTKKVEELTLYLIELSTQLKEQQKEIQKLKNK